MFKKDLILNIIGRRKVFYIISLVVIVAGLISFCVQGFNFGIDFTGGSYLQLTFTDGDVADTVTADAKDVDLDLDDEGEAEAVAEEDDLDLDLDEDTTADKEKDSASLEASDSKDAAVEEEAVADSEKAANAVEVSLADLRKVVNKYVEHTPTIQFDETNTAYVIRTDLTTEEEVQEMLAAIGEEIGPYQIDRDELVGPTIGNELVTKAILALAIACALMLVYISFRFQFWFGISSIVCLLHDALIVLSIFSIFQLEMSSNFVAAILTVIGYSINASIVIFDRVRETMPNFKASEKHLLLNESVSKTLARSLNTTLTTLFTLLALLIFGGDTTKIFILAITVGIVAGFYSSVCLASSVYYDLSTKLGGKKKAKKA